MLIILVASPVLRRCCHVLSSDHADVLEADSTQTPLSEHADIMLTMPSQRHSPQVQDELGL